EEDNRILVTEWRELLPSRRVAEADEEIESSEIDDLREPDQPVEVDVRETKERARVRDASLYRVLRDAELGERRVLTARARCSGDHHPACEADYDRKSDRRTPSRAQLGARAHPYRAHAGSGRAPARAALTARTGLG